MPARTRKQRHDDFTRERIQTTQLVNRLTNHALGKAKMSSTQVTAALGLLKKSLADLSNHQLSGDPENPVNVAIIERKIVRTDTDD